MKKGITTRTKRRLRSTTNRQGQSLSNSLLICRIAGTPDNTLHVLLDCPTLKPNTFSHLNAPALDTKNMSTKRLWEKGFRTNNAFVFDTFQRRISVGKPRLGPKGRPEQWFPELQEHHDDLHIEYRSKGGSVTLVMGHAARAAYKRILKRQKVRILHLSKRKAFEVWAELTPQVSGVYSSLMMKNEGGEICRIGVFVNHPGYFYFPRHDLPTLQMDNGCNFATALAGVDSLFVPDYFTTKYSKPLPRILPLSLCSKLSSLTSSGPIAISLVAQTKSSPGPERLFDIQHYPLPNVSGFQIHEGRNRISASRRCDYHYRIHLTSSLAVAARARIFKLPSIRSLSGRISACTGRMDEI